METDFIHDGITCLNGLGASVIDTFTITRKHIDVINIPYSGKIDLYAVAALANDDDFKLTEMCYMGTAVATSSYMYLTGLPGIAAEILSKQVIKPYLISHMIHRSMREDSLVDTFEDIN